MIDEKVPSRRCVGDTHAGGLPWGDHQEVEMVFPTTQISLLEQAQSGGSEQALLRVLEFAANFIAHRVRQLQRRYPVVGRDEADSAATEALLRMRHAIVDKRFVHPGPGKHA